MPKLIEIVGPPGSGKTFISSKLQKIKKNGKQIYFHSSDNKNFYKFKNLNLITKFLIKTKVIIIIINFYLIFYKRLFFKKIYKREFFYRTILLIYRHIHSIEMLKKILSDDEFLIMEPGIIMYFLQDYFYANETVSKNEIKKFNKYFLKSDFIIYSNCNSKLQLKRLKLRVRGLPQRMKDLSVNEINKSIKKANYETKKYFQNTAIFNFKLIKIDTTKSIREIKKKIFKILN